MTNIDFYMLLLYKLPIIRGYFMNIEIEEKSINNKKIYIFESHHEAILPWAELRATLNEAPVLLSLDHHTDIHEPFLCYCADNVTYEYNKVKAEECIKSINYKELGTIESAIEKLRNDEHIKTALKSDILSKALIISYDNSFDNPLSKEEKERRDNFIEIYMEQITGVKSSKYNYSRPFNYPDSDIYIPAIDDKNRKEELIYDNAIESDFLIEKFERFNEMVPKIVNKDYKINRKYILDIDLDYFHTIKSITPDDKNFFYDLIRNAEIITIAKERVCVDIVKIDNNLNSLQI